MSYNYFRLDNGIRIIHKLVASPIAHIGVVVNTGTREELPSERGIAHFIEHVIFKGTEKRNTYQVLSYLENIGGDLNAYTTKEETFFYASVLNQYLGRAAELLSDIIFHSTFHEKDIETEKDVVIEEIQLCKDTPTEWIFDEFENLIFKGSSLGTNILGTKKEVKQIKRETIFNFIAKNYNTDQMVIAIVGNVPFEQIKRIVSKYFALIPANKRQFRRKKLEPYQPDSKHIKIHSNQSHAVMGCVLPSYDERKNQIATLLSNILGGQGLNSRLNMAIREKKGYVYNIESSYSAMSDLSIFNIYIGCEQRNLDKCFELTHRELNKLRNVKLGTLQLHRAKLQMIGQVEITYESNLTEMLSIGKNHLMFEDVETIEGVVEKISTITADELIDMANEMLNIDNLSYITMGK